MVYVLNNIYGNKADFGHMPKGFKTPKLSNITRREARTSWLVTSEAVIKQVA